MILKRENEISDCINKKGKQCSVIGDSIQVRSEIKS